MQTLHRSSTLFPCLPAAPAVQSAVQTLKGVNAFITLLFDESGSLAPVMDLSNSLIDSSAFHLAIASMKTDIEVAAILSERYIAPLHDLEDLLHYPEGSLGYVYAHHMKQLGFEVMEPVVYGVPYSDQGTITSETHYVEYRWQQTHDIWHIITGFDTSEIGEIGLQAFYLAQFQLPLSSLLIANALISATVLQPTELNPLLEAIAQGYQMGKVARPLIAQRWETAWEKPVTLWRQELNVLGEMSRLSSNAKCPL